MFSAYSYTFIHKIWCKEIFIFPVIYFPRQVCVKMSSLYLARPPTYVTAPSLSSLPGHQSFIILSAGLLSIHLTIYLSIATSIVFVDLITHQHLCLPLHFLIYKSPRQPFCYLFIYTSIKPSIFIFHARSVSFIYLIVMLSISLSIDLPVNQ